MGTRNGMAKCSIDLLVRLYRIAHVMRSPKQISFPKIGQPLKMMLPGSIALNCPVKNRA